MSRCSLALVSAGCSSNPNPSSSGGDSAPSAAGASSASSTAGTDTASSDASNDDAAATTQVFTSADGQYTMEVPGDLMQIPMTDPQEASFVYISSSDQTLQGTLMPIPNKGDTTLDAFADLFASNFTQQLQVSTTKETGYNMDFAKATSAFSLKYSQGGSAANMLVICFETDHAFYAFQVASENEAFQTEFDRLVACLPSVMNSPAETGSTGEAASSEAASSDAATDGASSAADSSASPAASSEAAA